MRKPLLMLAVICIAAVGCKARPAENSGGDAVGVFSISRVDRESLYSQVEEKLDSLYWKYDFDTLFYDEATVFDTSEQSYNDIEHAAKTIGLDISGIINTNATVVGITLLHYDGEQAGQAYFYFSNNLLICAYYALMTDASIICSLNDKNVFSVKTVFDAYEDGSYTYPEPIRAVFKGVRGDSAPVTEKNRMYGKTLVSADEDKLRFYDYNDENKIFTHRTEMSFGDLSPFEMTYFDDGRLAVLLGEEDVDTEDDFHEGVKKEKEYISRRLTIIDKNLTIEYEAELDGKTYTALAAIEDTLLMCRGNTLEFYAYGDAGLKKQRQAILSHWTSSMEVFSFSGNAPRELIMTDGVNLHLCRLSEGDIVDSVWRTHYGTDTTFGQLRAADLNGDGVTEIYVTETSQTLGRYTLNQAGLKAETAWPEAGVYIFGDGGSALMIYTEEGAE